MRWLLLILVATAFSEEIPSWVMRGILRVETRSYYNADGSIKYIDKRRGSHGERGPFQCTKVAFNQVARKGEQFWMVETDTAFAEQIARRYILWLRDSYGGDWFRIIGMYNAGPNRTSQEYIKKVKHAGKA